jgi:hypothetical protein
MSTQTSSDSWDKAFRDSGNVVVLKRGTLEPLVPEAIVLFFVTLVIAIEGVRDNHFVAAISFQKR